MKKILKKIGLMFLVVTTVTIGFGGNIAKATTFTMADVALHNTAADCWMVINNTVYNLTSFVSTHSGGSAVIIAQCGKDGTATFNSGPHTSTTINAISSLILGTLASSTPPPVVTTPTLTSVTVVPSAPAVAVAGTVQITASPKDQNGGAFSGATTTFTSSNTAIATVSASGLVTGVSAGTATITATSVSGAVTVTGTATVTVTGTGTTTPTSHEGDENESKNGDNNHQKITTNISVKINQNKNRHNQHDD